MNLHLLGHYQVGNISQMKRIGDSVHQRKTWSGSMSGKLHRTRLSEKELRLTGRLKEAMATAKSTLP